jgi:hypothetical protein
MSFEVSAEDKVGQPLTVNFFSRAGPWQTLPLVQGGQLILLTHPCLIGIHNIPLAIGSS